MDNSKPDYPIDMSIKMLYFASKLFQEHGSFEWVPGWLARTLDLNGSALGIVTDQHCNVYFAWHDKNIETYSVKFAVGDLSCCNQDYLEKKNVPCILSDCPVIQSVFERHDQTDQEVTCFPIDGNNGFLMAYREGIKPGSFPIKEMITAISNIFACSLNMVRSKGKIASYFLPSEDMAQTWSEMLAGLSHDLRTPLACIKGYVTTLLRKDVTWDPVMQDDFLNIIVEETDHIESLIDSLLDSSTLSWKGEIELKKEPVLLPQIVNKILRDSSFRIKNHKFTVLFPEQFPYVEADPVRIEQVIRNLVDNAVKYSLEDTQILIKGEQAPGEVVVSVTDQGIGIDDEHLNRLFEKFFRVNTSVKEHQKGMGLGLPLTRQVLISHGGRIWAKSKIGQGTTLYFTLPYEPKEKFDEIPSDDEEGVWR